MISQDNIKPLVIAGAVGAAAGFGAKLLMDSGTKSRTTSGFLNVFNGLTFNIFSKVSEKTGTKESNVTAVVIALGISGAMYYLLGHNKASLISLAPNVNVKDHESSADQSALAGGVLGNYPGHVNVKGGSSKATNNSVSGGVISSDVATAFFANQRAAAQVSAQANNKAEAENSSP